MDALLLATALAKSFLGGEQTVEGAFARGSVTLGKPRPWLRRLAEAYIREFGGKTRPRERDVVAFFGKNRVFRGALAHLRRMRIEHWVTEPQQMQPVAAAREWAVPAIESSGDLAAWLGLTIGELDWFADLRSLERRSQTTPVLRNYHYRPLTKIYGSIRLIEAPKPRLKAIQRKILTAILDPIRPHPAVHGFVRGRSIRSFVAPHAGQRVILRMDLRDFFPSIGRPRIQAIFRTIGYPESVADCLGGICTNSVPASAWKNPGMDIDLRQVWEARMLYAQPHLPQGAPTSPSLANLCAYRFDRRLRGLAESAGACYTRYADDLAFSGGDDFDRRVERFALHVAAILTEEGFHVHHRKTRIMRRGVRQHLAGLVANEHVNVMRPDFDLLKATLNNCARKGPASQNREGHANYRMHLEGRVAFVESINPAKGRRLRAIFDRISWV